MLSLSDVAESHEHFSSHSSNEYLRTLNSPLPTLIPYENMNVEKIKRLVTFSLFGCQRDDGPSYT